MKQKTRLNILEISVSTDISAHEWPIYRYRPQKSHISRSLIRVAEKISFGFVGHHCRDITTSEDKCVFYAYI